MSVQLTEIPWGAQAGCEVTAWNSAFLITGRVFHLFTHHAQMPPEVRSGVHGPLGRQHSFRNALLLQRVRVLGHRVTFRITESQNCLGWKEP